MSLRSMPTSLPIDRMHKLTRKQLFIYLFIVYLASFLSQAKVSFYSCYYEENRSRFGTSGAKMETLTKLQLTLSESLTVQISCKQTCVGKQHVVRSLIILSIFSVQECLIVIVVVCLLGCKGNCDNGPKIRIYL